MIGDTMHVIVIRKNVTGILLIELCEALCTFDNGDGDDDDDHHGHFDDDEDGDLGRCWLDADDALFLLLPLMTIVMMMVGVVPALQPKVLNPTVQLEGVGFLAEGLRIMV